MIIKAILITILLLTLVYFINNSNKIQVRAWKRIFLLFVAAIGVFSVLFPNALDDAANFVGIGRGADLLLYALAISFFFATVNTYLKFKEQELRLNKIVSKLAILEKEKNE